MRKRTVHVVVLTNLLAPYRIALLNAMFETVDLTVIQTGHEGNRPPGWAQSARESPRFSIISSRSIQMRRRLYRGSRIEDTKYMHMPLNVVPLLRRLNPDVIVSSELGLRTLSTVIFRGAGAVPIVVWWGGTPDSERNIGMARRLLRLVIKRHVDHWFVYGREAKKYVRSLGVPDHRISFAWNCVGGLPKRKAAADDSIHLKSSSRLALLYVGQLIGRKGVDTLLRAVGELKDAGCRVSLLIAGSGPEREALVALARQMALEETYFLGEVSYEAVFTLYEQADIVVLPSRREVWGLVVNEALASGTPVVASNRVGAATDMCPPAARFSADSPAELADVVRSVWADVRAGTFVQCTGFDPRMVGSDMARILKRLAGSHRRA